MKSRLARWLAWWVMGAIVSLMVAVCHCLFCEFRSYQSLYCPALQPVTGADIILYSRMTGGESVGFVGLAGLVSKEFVVLDIAEADLPTWSELHTFANIGAMSMRANQIRVEQATGWPLLCLASVTYGSPASTSNDQWIARRSSQVNIQVRANFVYTLGTPADTAFPSRVLWFGLFVNSLFWALVARTLVWANGHIRRPRRRLPVCSTCGYDLRGISAVRCPECGEPSRRV